MGDLGRAGPCGEGNEPRGEGVRAGLKLGLGWETGFWVGLGFLFSFSFLFPFLFLKLTQF